MNLLDSLVRYWPVIAFVCAGAFVLGGYAVMIAILRQQVSVLFEKSKNRDEQMQKIDTDRAVLTNELTNVKDMVKDVKGMLASLASEIRSGGHVRKNDLE